jgi:ribosomal protein S18 acetylase RimI-like enzyme
MLTPTHIREMTKDDIPKVAQIHKIVFPSFFTTNLGEIFLIKYYESFLDANHSISLVAEKGRKVVGFIVGTYRSPEHRIHLYRTIIPLISTIVFDHLIFSPEVILLILKYIKGGLAYFLKRYFIFGIFFWFGNLIRIVPSYLSALTMPTTSPGVSVDNVASLTSIAVSSEGQLGLGLMLINEFVDRACKSGVKAILSSTDGWNRSARRTFIRAGFTFLERQREYKRTIDIFIYRCCKEDKI